MTDHTTDHTPTAVRSIVVIADADSRVRWGMSAAREIAGPGTVVHGLLLQGPTNPSDQQLAELAPGTTWTPVDLVAAGRSLLLRDADVVVVSTRASRTWAIIDALRQRAAEERWARRPLTVCGYVGAVLQHHLEGLVWRLGADVICVNSERDRQTFAGWITELGLDDGVLLRTGYLTATPTPGVDDDVAPRVPRHVVFAVQSLWPASRVERAHLVDQLHAFALANPGSRVDVKLRTRPGETTPHPERHPYPDIIEERLPADHRLNLVYGPMADALEGADACVTVSSTAALEAMALGIPTLILTDFGLGESVGNHYFVGSGCLGTLTDLADGRVRRADQAWLDTHGFFVDDPGALRRRVTGLLDAQADADGPLPWPRPWYTRSTLPLRVASSLAGEARAARRAGEGMSVPKRAVAWVLTGPVRTAARRLSGWATS